MTNSTADYWDVDGVSLQTYAWNITTLGGRTDPPPLRGENVVAPQRPGSIWRPKVPDARILTLGMWVKGVEQDGDVPADQRGYFLVNSLFLKRTLWQPYRQMVLTKRYAGGTGSMTANAQFVSGLELEMKGDRAAAFTVDLLLADPFFYQSTVTAANAKAVGTHDLTGVITGDTASPRHTVVFTGPLTNPSITIKKGTSVLSVCSYAGVLGSGESLTVAFPSFSYSGAGSPLNVTSQQDMWLVLDPAATSLVVGGTGAGSVTLTYEPAWF